jgi:hypothetical protein
MNKTILSMVVVVMSLLTSYQTFAGGPSCTPDTSGSCTGLFGAVCPDVLPDATVGTSYSQTVTFFIPAEVDTNLPIVGAITIPVDTAIFLGVTGLPDGLNFSISSQTLLPEPGDVPSQYGCMAISGTPCGGQDTITFTLDFLLAVTSPFGAFQLPQSFEVTFVLNSTVPVIELTATKTYLCASDQSDLSVQNVFTTYAWSTTETTNAITVTAAGVYKVTVTDAGGCEQTASYEVFDLDADAASTALTICENAIAQLSGSGGETFTWSPSTGLSATNVANPVVYDLTANQTYKLLVSNGTCSDSVDVVVTVQACTSDCTPAAPNRSCTASAGNFAGACPGAVPNITGGTAYNTSVSFFFPGAIPLDDVVLALVGTSLPGLPQIDVSPESVVVSDVTGLPAGLNWSCDQLSVGGGSDCVYYPALYPAVTQYGAISICGTSCGAAATDSFRIVLTITATLPDAVPFLGGTQQDFDVEVPVAFSLIYTNPLTITASATGVLPVGTPVTLSASATGFTGYSWTPGGATTADIIVNTGGTYTVSANDGNCVQAASYLVEYASGIEDINVSSINIFPNPNKGSFAVAFDAVKATDVTVGVFNVQGQEVYTENVNATIGKNTKQVNLNNLSSGIYIVKLFVDGGSVSRRITLY